jgi:LemA protein
VTLGQQVSKAWANIDVALKQRHDELPNLVEAVGDLMAFERETLTRVTRLRAAYSPSEPVPAQAATSEATSSAVRGLLAVVERYPEVRSQANVLDLQGEIERLEEVIAARRELYNDTVYRFDTRIRQVPTNLLAWAFGWEARPFFSAPAGGDSRLVVDLERHPG